MTAAKFLTFGIVVALSAGWRLEAAEANPPPPRITIGTTTNGQPRLVFPYPAAEQYNIFSAPNGASPFVPDSFSGQLLGPTFIVTNGGPSRLYQVSVTPMSSDDLFAATVLNRLCYGPSPGDIDHIRAIGPEAFINEQLAGETIPETINTDPPLTNPPPPAPPLTNWIRVVATGTPSGRNFGIVLSQAGQVYIDNLVLVAGTSIDSGTNILVNGNFELPPLTNGWGVGSSILASATMITNSPTVDGQAASGTNCLLLTASATGETLTTGVFQVIPTNVPIGGPFTWSYYYLPVQNVGTNRLSVRATGLSGRGEVNLPSAPVTPPPPPPAISPTYARLTNSTATLDDLRAWHVFRGIHSKRQLHEVLAQFFQNHLTTQYDKTKDYFDNGFVYGIYTNEAIRASLAVDLHWREHKAIRDALLNPNCTFYDLLKISIESPAMIIYLDTILSSKAAPNQNYAREILELHAMGADNGYDQEDIAELSKVWTGWRVDKKDASVADNPFATPISRANLTNFANTPGLWVLHYNTNSHHTGTKSLFTNGPIHPRFGSQFGAGQSYALILSSAQASNTNGFNEGYRVAQHLANLPYTMEFVSVKLCQLFVHEGFEYGIYDYTSASPTPEVQLIKDCMTAWNTAASDGRKGNIRSVLRTIFNSALFRGHGASHQKVKTPLEYAVSAVRALRISNTDTNGYFVSTCESDGYGISGLRNTSPLSRMGGMGLFNRAEPDGFSELGRIWLNTANLCERMRFVQHLMMPSSSSLKASDSSYGAAGAGNTSDPVRLLREKLPGSMNNAGAVVDFFLGLFYPGDGAGNLGRDRQAAIDHLNTSEAGANSPFTNLTGAAYDGRVRSMVGFLLSLPRFQEQ